MGSPSGRTAGVQGCWRVLLILVALTSLSSGMPARSATTAHPFRRSAAADADGDALSGTAGERGRHNARILCQEGEHWLGRYCDRVGGHPGLWYEKCYVARSLSVPLEAGESGDPDLPVPPTRHLKPGELPDAAWLSELRNELETPTVYDTDIHAQPGAVYSARHQRWHLGREIRYEHVCPEGAVCVQAIDSDYSPHVFCRFPPTHKQIEELQAQQQLVLDDPAKLYPPQHDPSGIARPRPWSRVHAHDIGGGRVQGTFTEPWPGKGYPGYNGLALHAEAYTIVKLDPDPASSPGGGGGGGGSGGGVQVQRVTRSVRIATDMPAAAFSIVLYDPATMRLVHSSTVWRTELTRAAPGSGSGADASVTELCSTTGTDINAHGGATAGCAPFSLIALRQGEQLRVWYKQLDDLELVWTNKMIYKEVVFFATAVYLYGPSFRFPNRRYDD